MADSGLKTIETGAFVAAPWVPQMSDSHDVLTRLNNYKNLNYPVLVPNFKGLKRALAAGAKEIAIFGAASETFSMKNINCSIEKALERFVEVIQEAKVQKLRVRG